jgi:hypothetical protein
LRGPKGKKTVRQNVYAKARRKMLVALLGGECAICGRKDRLHIDHVKGKSWDAKKLSSWQRVKRYWEEYRAGVPMRTLCISCSSGYHPVDPRYAKPEAVQAAGEQAF